MASWLLGTLYENIVPVFIGKYYSPAQLGVYNRAAGYANLLSKNATGVLQGVTFPVLSKIQDDTEDLAHKYRKMIRVSAFIIFPMMLLLSALARPLIIVMITAKWESCIILLQIMCFSMMWYPIHAINLNLLQVKGRTDLFFRLEVVKKLYGLIILAITLPMGLIALCVGGVFSSLIALFINTWYTGKLIQVGFKKQMRDLLPILGMSLVMYLCVSAFCHIFPNMYIQILVGGILGFIVYIILAIITKRDEISEVKYLLRLKK